MVGAASYLCAALGFAVLLVLLWLGSGRVGVGRFLIAACALSLLWAVVLASAGWVGSLAVSLAEVLRQAGWILFLSVLLYLARPPGRRGQRDPWTLVAVASFGLGAVGQALVAAPPQASPWLGYALLAMAATGVAAVVEQFYRRLPPSSRWAMKHLCIALGLIFAFDFYVYASVMVTGGLAEPHWYARGLVNALVVPLIAVAAARNPSWNVDIGVSRKVVTESAVVTAAGGFLVLMGAAGYYVREFGGSWGAVLQSTLIAAALAVLLVALLSGTLRARARLLVSKHFFSYRYDYREEWLRFIGTLADSRSQQPLRVRAVRAVAQIVDCPSGALWAVNENGHLALAATFNVSLHSTLTVPAGSPLARFLRRTGWIVDLDEFAARPERYPGLELPECFSTLSTPWLIVPLMEHEHLEGFIVLGRPLAPRPIEWEDRDLLKTAGRQAAGYVALVKVTEALADRRQFDAFNRLSAFVVHDLNNVQAQLALVSTNAARFRDNPEFIDDALKTTERASARLQGVLSHLRKSDPVAPAGGEPRPCRVVEALSQVERQASGRLPVPRLVAEVDPRLAVAADHSRLVTMLDHLVRNAQEASADDEQVSLEAWQDGHQVVIEVADHGAGMEEDFLHERLFRPFDTSKGNAGMGVGVYEVRQFVEAAGGVLDIHSRPGEGTRVVLTLPLAPTDEDQHEPSLGQAHG